jgi:helix-turn-helix protein
MPKSDELSAESVRLNAILRLMLDYQREKKGTTIGDQILILIDSGLPQAEACKALGVDPSQAPSYFRRAKDKDLLRKLGKRKSGGTSK